MVTTLVSVICFCDKLGDGNGESRSVEEHEVVREGEKGIKIGWFGSGKMGMVELQAVAKLILEKSVFVDAMVKTLGKIWCPIRGLGCKEVGGTPSYSRLDRRWGRE